MQAVGTNHVPAVGLPLVAYAHCNSHVTQCHHCNLVSFFMKFGIFLQAIRSVTGQNVQRIIRNYPQPLRDSHNFKTSTSTAYSFRLCGVETRVLLCCW